MKDMLKIVGLGVIGGAAYQAGASLWNNVLEDKVRDLGKELKKKKESKKKIVKFKRLES